RGPGSARARQARDRSGYRGAAHRRILLALGQEFASPGGWAYTSSTKPLQGRRRPISARRTMSESTITRIEVYKLTLPKEPFRISLGTMAQLENILVRVESSDGLYGLGEGSPFPFITGETQAIAYEAALALARL